MDHHDILERIFSSDAFLRDDEVCSSAGGCCWLPSLLLCRNTYEVRRQIQIFVIAIADFDDRGERRFVAHVGCDRLGALAVPVEQHDLACRAAHDRGQGTRGPDRSHADNADFMRCSH
jgi:hypothetical protein